MLKILFVSLIIAFTLAKPMDELDLETENQQKVVVYNWSNYIPKGVLEDFSKETGIKVEYSTYDNNEIMYTRLKLLKGRGYDVLVPSTSLVGKMSREGLLQPLDHTQLEHFEQLDPDLINKSYDPGNKFSVPYLWGTPGIAVNTDVVDVAKIKGWADLWDRQWRGRLLLTDDMREVFSMALTINKHSPNTIDPDEIKQAYEKLRRLMPGVKVLSGEPRAEFLSGNVDLGLVWNGEIVVAQQEKPALQYIYPEEGANFWVDSFVIPARAANVENAHKFIDYMLRPEVAARCVKELGYATPILAARALLDTGIRNNPVIFPPSEVLTGATFQEDVGDKAMDLYNLYWGKLKAGK
ncbi:MAG: extracellular solute-binding protein [Thiothrix litoralis]